MCLYNNIIEGGFAMKEEFDYATEIKIDPNALDVEWLEQPQLFMKYAEAAVNARTVMDRAKENLDVCRAELDLEVRSKFEKKPTESQIANTIITEDRYKEENMKYIEAKHEYDILSAAVRAFDQKKSALENLVRLQGQQYFAGPQEPRDLGMEWDSRVKQKAARDKIKRSIRGNNISCI